MTKPAVGDRTGRSERPRCAWCGRPLERRQGPGRPRRYCRQGCRQQAYIARRWSADHGLRPDDVVVPRATLDELLGKLYCLQAAVEDVERDLAADDGPEEVRAALGWLLENARPLQDAWVDPVAVEE